jgi:transcription antitermination factor NusG
MKEYKIVVKKSLRTQSPNTLKSSYHAIEIILQRIIQKTKKKKKKKLFFCQKQMAANLYFSLLFGSSKTKKKKTLRRYVLIHATALFALYISLLVHS